VISIFNPYAIAVFALALIGASLSAYTKGRIDGSDVAKIESLQADLKVAKATIEAEQKAKAEIQRQAEAQRTIGEQSAAGEVALAAAAAAATARADQYEAQLRREREERAKDACPIGFLLSPADVEWLRSIGAGNRTAPAPARPPDAPAGPEPVR